MGLVFNPLISPPDISAFFAQCNNNERIPVESTPIVVTALKTDTPARQILANQRSADFDLGDKVRVRSYLTVNYGGCFRQIGDIVGQICEIFKTLPLFVQVPLVLVAIPALALSILVLSVISFVVLIVTGLINAYAAMAWTIPDNMNAVDAAKCKLDSLKIASELIATGIDLNDEAGLNTAITEQVGLFPVKLDDEVELTPEVEKERRDALEKGIREIIDIYKELDPTQKELLHTALADAEKAFPLAKLGLKNHYLYGLMGAAQSTNGILGILVLFGLLAPIFVTAVGYGLSAVFIERGRGMEKRSRENLKIVKEFNENLAIEAAKGSDAAIEFMKKAEILDKLHPGYLARRVDDAFLRRPDKFDPDVTWIYAATGKQKRIRNEAVTIVPEKYDEKGKLQYLEGVYKGIFTEELRQKQGRKIAIAMILGGIFMIIALSLALVYASPFILAAVCIISAIFFLCMEENFLEYDNPDKFAPMRDSAYEKAEKPEWLRNLQAAEQRIRQEKFKEAFRHLYPNFDDNTYIHRKLPA